MQLVRLVEDSDTVAEPKPQRTAARERLAAALDLIAQRQAEAAAAQGPALGAAGRLP